MNFTVYKLYSNWTFWKLYYCLRSWRKIHYNSLRRVYSHTWLQITTFLWHSWFCFKLSHQWILAKRGVFHNRACHRGKATVPSCHSSVGFMDQKLNFLQHYKDESSKWNVMKVLFLSCSPKTILIGFIRTRTTQTLRNLTKPSAHACFISSPLQFDCCHLLTVPVTAQGPFIHWTLPETRSWVKPWSYSSKPEVRSWVETTQRQNFFTLRKIKAFV